MSAEIADDYKDLAYGPPSPFEASPDQPGSFGPPSDVFTDKDALARGQAAQAASGSADPASSGNDFDISGVLKAGLNAAGSIAKTVGTLANPQLPRPQLPATPAPPNLPATMPPLPPGVPSPGASARPSDPASNVPAVLTPQTPAPPAKPGLSRGAKIAIGAGAGACVLGGGLILLSRNKSKGR